MPRTGVARVKRNQLTFGINGGSAAYSPSINSPAPTRPPPLVQRLETICHPDCGAAAEPTSQAVATPRAKSSLRSAAAQIHALSDRGPSGFAPREGYQLSEIEKTFRHAFWAARRGRIFSALQGAQVSGRRLENFANCGSNAWVISNRKDGSLKTTASYCRDRFCQACQQSRAGRIARGLARRIPQHKTLHVVLTLRSNDDALGDQLDRLYKASAKLRSRKWWSSKVLGGSQTLELTRNTTTGQWHPHLHLLVHAQWLKQQDLADLWHKVTGDSSIVHVSLVTNNDAAIREVTKYLAKPIHRSIDFDPASLIDQITALKGRRLIGTFGSWRKDPLLADEAEDPADDWHPLMPLHSLYALAAQGDTWARQALSHLHSHAPGRQLVPPPPVPPDG